MRQFKQIYTLGVLLLMGARATSINDLQLERVRPIAGFHPAGRPAEHDFRQSGGVVLEFSSAWDSRRQVARFGSSFFAVVERCAGRTHIVDPGLPRQWISHGEFVDELGVLSRAGRGSEADPIRLTPAEGIPSNGRFYFVLPVHLEAYAMERTGMRSGWETRRRVDQDLLRAPDDLCVFARDFTYFQGVWRSNTVVIPYAGVRAALDASHSPAPLADSPGRQPPAAPR